MIAVGIFVAGFASGWVARSTVDSSRGMAVAAVATYFKAVERVKRIVAIEREHLEDLVAEGRTKFETDRARARVRTAAEESGRADRAASGPRGSDTQVMRDAQVVGNAKRERAA